MTDSDFDPLDPLDELASATLDGAGAPGDDPTLDNDDAPELAERVARLAQVRDQLAAPVAPPSDDVRDRMIARAISAGASADADAPATDASSTVAASVTSLAAHRSRRGNRLRRFAPIAAAALVLLVVAIVTPALLDSGEEDVASTGIESTSNAEGVGGELDDTAADEANDSRTGQALAPDAGDTAATPMEEEMAGVEAAADPEDSTVLIVPSPQAAEPGDVFSADDLGAEVSDEELLDAVIRYLARQPADSPEPPERDNRCAGVVDHPIDLVASGSYRAQPAAFFVQIDGSAVLAVTVVDPACEVLTLVTSG